MEMADGGTAVVFVPGPWGSFGDEAMMVASSQYLKRSGVGRLIILSYGREDCWPAVGMFTGAVRCQDKFEGLYTHFQVEGVTLGPRDVVEPGRFSVFMTDLIDRRGELRDCVRTRVPQVVDLSRRIFDLLFKGSR